MSRIFWWVVAAVVVIAAIVVGIKNSGNAPDLFGSPSPSVSGSVSPVPSYTSGTGGAVNNSTYTSLVAEYAGRRIQFDKYCQAIPSNPVFKTGTRVMFDNRSGDARIINIGGIAYHFPGYGYRLILLGSTHLPVSVNLDCGSAIHVGTITVEK